MRLKVECAAVYTIYRAKMHFPIVLCKLIEEYADSWYMLPWIDASRLREFYLSRNPRAIGYLTEHPEMISWDDLAHNHGAGVIDLLRGNMEKINNLAWLNHDTRIPYETRLMLSRKFPKIVASPSQLQQNDRPGPTHREFTAREFMALTTVCFREADETWFSDPIADDDPFVAFVRAGYTVFWSQILPDVRMLPFIRAHFDLIPEYARVFLTENPGMIDVLLANPQTIDIRRFSINPHPRAREFIKNFVRINGFHKGDARIEFNEYTRDLFREYDADGARYTHDLGANPAIFERSATSADIYRAINGES